MNFTDKTTPTDFENLCYDLLKELGFENLSWRKGTGTDASPADQGRDIEAMLPKKEIDGSSYKEKWFIECKRHKQGIPPKELQGALAWAEAEMPHTLLLVASAFFSNSTKEYLKNYEANRKPAFRMRIWEAPDLERMLSGRARILNKYKLSMEFPYWEILHPAHKQYIRKPSLNTLSYFLSIVDELDDSKRRNWLFGAFLLLINPRADKPVSGDQTLGELSKTPISYHQFKIALDGARNCMHEFLLVQAIVNNALANLLRCGDITSLEEYSDNHRFYISHFEKEIIERPSQKKVYEECIELSRQKLITIEDDLKKGYEDYCGFCEKILVPLFDERFQIPEEVLGQALER